VAAKKPQDGVNVLAVINHPELTVHEMLPFQNSSTKSSNIAFISSHSLVIIVQLQKIKRVHA
jgi:hypothetical protein